MNFNEQHVLLTYCRTICDTDSLVFTCVYIYTYITKLNELAVKLIQKLGIMYMSRHLRPAQAIHAENDFHSVSGVFIQWLVA